MADAIQKMTPDGENFSIYGVPANINYFINSALEPDTVDGVVNVQQNVKAHIRRRYVGDINGSNVSSHSRELMYDPGRKVGNALPGFSFILDDGTEKRQFTLNGDVIDLHSYLSGQVKNQTKLYTNGARYVIPAAAAPGAL